jgi:hypothetical protein
MSRRGAVQRHRHRLRDRGAQKQEEQSSDGPGRHNVDCERSPVPRQYDVGHSRRPRVGGVAIYRFFCDPRPPPDRDPARRRPELPRVPFFDPVPDAPGLFALFRAPVDPRPDVCPFRPRGASGFEPRPRAAACEVRDLPSRPSTSPLLSDVVRALPRDAVPRDRPPRPPPPPPIVSSAASRVRAPASASSDCDSFSRRAIRCPPSFSSARPVPTRPQWESDCCGRCADAKCSRSNAFTSSAH